jgi:hypothetical protein
LNTDNKKKKNNPYTTKKLKLVSKYRIQPSPADYPTPSPSHPENIILLSSKITQMISIIEHLSTP